MSHRVTVNNLPAWLDSPRLLGPGEWSFARGPEGQWVQATATLSSEAAADLGARLRGIGLGGRRLVVACVPPLSRSKVRAARTEDARRRRKTSPGMTRRGTRLDTQGRYSLTPELLALELGKRACRVHVVDAGCGSGGNTVGFARAGCRVTAIERDPSRAQDARHNARCYEVADQISVITGSVEQVLATIETDATRDILFVDPPWGREWDRHRIALESFELLTTCLRARKKFAAVWAKLPPSSDVSTCLESHIEAVFGHQSGDSRRIKFVLVRFPGHPA
ncbi:MAG: methyltransferase domain-containing protein [Nannocystaceae bacterium]